MNSPTFGVTPTLLRCLLALSLVGGVGAVAWGADRQPDFEASIRPILAERCFGCHGDGSEEGGVVLDRFATTQSASEDRQLWYRVLKQLRAGLMPPVEEQQPSAGQRDAIEQWIKSAVFHIDPADPDPGRVTVRRLNRVEYRNTVRDLMGVDFDTTSEFPPDDTGHGFDNIADVLTISPLMLEKYIDAAKKIVEQAVPTTAGVADEKRLPGGAFRSSSIDSGDISTAGADTQQAEPLTLSYYEPATVVATVRIPHSGDYQLVVDLLANETFVSGQSDLNKCRLTLRVDGREVFTRDFTRQNRQPFQFTIDHAWEAGEHPISLEVQPLTPAAEQIRALRLDVNSVVIRGPMDPKHWTLPANHERFFPRPVPDGVTAQRDYAREVLAAFCLRAFRRPANDETLGRLVGLAERTYSRDSKTFEAGIAQAITAILCAPRFLFRGEELVLAEDSSRAFPLVDEFALASRLSYFFWSSMPDAELLRLAQQNRLRAELSAQVARLLSDDRSQEFVGNFVGQWLQARDIDSIQVSAFRVISRDRAPDPEAERRRDRFRELRRKEPEELSQQEQAELEEIREEFFASFRRFREFDLDRELRGAMRRETEMLFDFVLRENRSVLELIDADYTFLNERLAKHYAIEGVAGEEMRLVSLPQDSPRGGVLTQGTVLAVTSNPDRTSPVKRGLFVLENLLGTPPAAPPPDIPALEDVAGEEELSKMTLRETLALHRQDSLCSSCHNRMDPLGLALENFNALGMWREEERGKAIAAAGMLITGEKFPDVRALKQVLATERRGDFYRCLTEKMLTYALGRGLEDFDVFTVDSIVDALEDDGGRAMTLVTAIVNSAPFQRSRLPHSKNH